MRPISPALRPTEEETPKFIPIYNRGEFLVKSKEIKENFALVVKEKVTTSIEIPKKMKPMLEEFKEVVHDKPSEGLQPMRDIQHHDTSIIHGLENPFMQKESVRDESFRFFNFISPSISTWARRVLHGMPSSISNCTSKNLLHGGESMKYGSMVCMYG